MKDFFHQVEDLLVENNLLTQIPIDEKALVDDRRFLVVPCQDKLGKKWIFKIQYFDEPTLEQNFLNEVKFLELTQKYPQITNHVPIMKDFGYFRGKLWYLREFVDGQMLGKDEDTFPYDPKILSQLDSSAVAKFFYDLSHPSLEEVLEAIPQIKRYDLRWQAARQLFLQDHPEILKLKEKKLAYFTPEEQERLFNLLLHPPKKILSENSWALSHANLSPTNIIFCPPRKLVFIDWENVCWGLRTADFSEFWYRSFTHRNFQKDFFAARLSFEKNQEDFLAIFYFSLIVGNAGLLEYLTGHWQKGKMEKETYERAVELLTDIIREGMIFLELKR